MRCWAVWAMLPYNGRPLTGQISFLAFLLFSCCVGEKQLLTETNEVCSLVGVGIYKFLFHFSLMKEFVYTYGTVCPSAQCMLIMGFWTWVQWVQYVLLCEVLFFTVCSIFNWHLLCADVMCSARSCVSLQLRSVFACWIYSLKLWPILEGQKHFFWLTIFHLALITSLECTKNIAFLSVDPSMFKIC